MILRNFLFLDTDTLANYLSTFEGYREVEVDEEVSEQTKKGGKLSVKLAEGVGGTEKISSTKRRLATTSEAQFQRLYEILDEEGEVQYLDAFDQRIWDQLNRGEIIEVQANLRLPKIYRQIREAGALSPWLDLLELAGHNPLDDPLAKEAVHGMQALNKTLDSQPIPLLFEPIATRGFQLFAKLPYKYLRCSPMELEGDAVVFGKILRFVVKGKRETVFSLIPEFEALTNANRQQSRAMKKQRGLVEEMKGPALILSATAIYM